MSSEKRRHDRFYARLPVVLHMGRTQQRSETVDVSYGGLFVATSEPPPVRQLLTIEVTVPEEDAPISLMAMPVFVDPDGSRSGAPGTGLKLFGVDKPTQDRWEKMVRHIRALPSTRPVPGNNGDADAPPPPPCHDGRWSHVLPEVLIRVDSTARLRTILLREFGRGRIYVRTPLELQAGAAVELRIEHPASHEIFVLEGAVDRRVDRTDFEGLRVLLPNLTDFVKVQFENFIRTGQAPNPRKAAG